MKLEISSSVPRKYKRQLEALFFFNPDQGRCLQEISEEIRHSGQPRMEERGGRLHLRLERIPEVQTYFFLNADGDQLLGAAMAYRRGMDCFRIIHWAVSASAAQQVRDPSLMMLTELRRVLGRIQGITHLELPYPKKAKRLRIRVL